MNKKSLILAFSLAAVAVTESISFAATRSELADTVPAARDFSFGLPQQYFTVTSLDTDNTSYGTWMRFLDTREKYPNEIPIFKPYDVNGKIEIFVSVTGSDDGDGSIDKPFKTLERAFTAVGQINDKTGGVVIYLREGIYNASNGITIPKYVSGGKTNPLVISSYKDEKVSIVGGITVRGQDAKVADDEFAKKYLKEEAYGRVYSVNLKELGYNDYPQISKTASPALVVNGTSYNLARWPNSGTTKMKKLDESEYKYGVIDSGPVTSTLGGKAITGDTGGGFEFVPEDSRPLSWHNDGNIWMYGSFGVEYLKGQAQIQDIKSFKNDMASIRTVSLYGPGASYSTHCSFYYFNVFEELDEPGEWYMDRNTGMLYIYPLTELSGNDIDIATSDENLITFESNTHDVVINGINVKNGKGNGIVVQGYNNVIQNCDFSDLGASGVRIANSTACGVTCSTLVRTNGVTVASNIGSQSPVNFEGDLRPTRNFVQNCYSVGGSISVNRGCGDVVSHNTVINTNSAFGINQALDCIFEYNEAAGVPLTTNDTGVIYVNGSVDCVGNHVRYNFFHDSNKYRQDPFGIYFDDMTSGCYAYGNILKDNIIYLHGGFFNTIYNNLLFGDVKTSAVMNSNHYWGGSKFNDIFRTQYLMKGAYRSDFDFSYFFKSNSLAWASQFPATTKWMQDMIDMRYRSGYGEDPNYEKNEEDIAALVPQKCVYKNNAVYQAYGVNTNIDGETDALFENNVHYGVDDTVNYNGKKVTARDAIFKDYENGNYNLREDSVIYSQIPDFEKLPDTNKIGVIVRDDLMKDIFKMGNMYSIYPPNDTQRPVFPGGIEFKWTEPTGASYYEIVIAKDAEYKDIIADQKVTANTYTYDGAFEPSTVYYWRVTAYSYAQSIDTTPIVVESSFKTLTYEEAVEKTVKDFSNYDSIVSKWEGQLEYIKESSDNEDKYGYGTYKPGTLDSVRTAIEKSKETAQNCGLQSELDSEAKRLNSEITQLLSDNSMPFVRTYKNSLDANDWSVFASGETQLSVENNEFLFRSMSGLQYVLDMRPLTPRETVRCQVNFGDMNGWEAFAIRKTPDSISPNGGMILGGQGGGGYYIVVKQDYIELQRCPQIVGQIRVSVANDNKIIAPNTWVEIECSCETIDGESHVIFKVDGKTIIDYTSKEDAVEGSGYFGFMNNPGANSGIRMRPCED